MARSGFIAISAVFLFLLSSAEEAPIDPLTIFHRECVSCHTESKRKGGLLIDSKESLVKGGDTGSAIVPGKASESYLVETLFPDHDSHMPPKGQLEPREIAAIEKWIDSGAGWDAEKWAKLNLPEKTELTRGTMPQRYQPVLAMALSPDSRTLVVGRGNQIEWFRVLAGEGDKPPLSLESTHISKGHTDSVQSLAFSHDGARVASGGFRKLLLWDPKEPEKPVQSFEDPFLGRQSALLFLKDPNRILVADSLPSRLGRLHEITLETGAVRSFDTAHLDSIFQLTPNHSGTQYATTSADKLVTIRDAKTHEIVTRLEGHTGYVIAAAFSPEDKRIATAGDDEEIKVWNLETGKKTGAFGNAKSGPYYGLDWLIDPANEKKRSEEKDPEKAKEINTDRIFSVAEFGKPAAYIELNEHEGEQRSTGAKERAFDAVTTPLFAMAVHPERQWIFAGGENGELYVWDENGKLKQTIESSIEATPPAVASNDE